MDVSVFADVDDPTHLAAVAFFARKHGDHRLAAFGPGEGFAVEADAHGRVFVHHERELSLGAKDRRGLGCAFEHTEKGEVHGHDVAWLEVVPNAVFVIDALELG